MKTYSIFLLIFLTAFADNLKAQCEVDAGENLHLCVNINTGTTDTGSLEGQILSGIPPFNFQWETSEGASNYLENPNALSSKIISGLPHKSELVLFWLTATDSIGNVCRDSVYFSLSSFGALGSDLINFINTGDTAVLSGIAGSNDFTPHTIAWSPNYNISDTTSFLPVAWPDTTITYQMILTDSVGCTFQDRWRVFVFSVSTENIFTGAEHFKTYPNPNKGIFFFEKTDKSQMNGTLELLDLTGKIIFSKKVENQVRGEIDFPDLASGNYFIRLFEKEKVLVGQIKID